LIGRKLRKKLDKERKKVAVLLRLVIFQRRPFTFVVAKDMATLVRRKCE
jgi:hypothetical protein